MWGVVRVIGRTGVGGDVYVLQPGGVENNRPMEAGQMEKTVSLTCVAAILLWVATFALVGAGSVVGIALPIEHRPWSLALMSHGLACSAAAATVTIKRLLTITMGDAFELGQTTGSSQVRRMR